MRGKAAALWVAHYVAVPLALGLSVQLAVLWPLCVASDATLCLSLVAAWMQGLVLWEVTLPLAPLPAPLADYYRTPFRDLAVWRTLRDVYWPLLATATLH